MRKAITVFVTSAAAAVAALAIGVSGAVGESGPACADITGENHTYPTRGTLNLGLILAGAVDATSSTPCKSVVYTVVVSGITGPPVVVSRKGDNLFPGITFSDTDDNVCISATSASSGGRIHDAAPNQGCLEISVGSTGGVAGFG